VKSWTKGGASSVRANDDTSSAVCLSPVPPQLFIGASTDGATLVAPCAERTIPAGANDSLQSLKISLLRFDVSASTVKGARMLEAMAYVRGEAQKGRGELADYQAVVVHPVGVTIDVAAGLSAADGRCKTVPPIGILGDAPMPPQAATPPSTAPPALGAVVARCDSVDLTNSPRFNASDVCTPPRSDAPPGCPPRYPTGAVGAVSPSIGDSADLPS